MPSLSTLGYIANNKCIYFTLILLQLPRCHLGFFFKKILLNWCHCLLTFSARYLWGGKDFNKVNRSPYVSSNSSPRVFILHIYIWIILSKVKLKILVGLFLHHSSQNWLIHYIKSFEMFCSDLYAIKCKFVGGNAWQTI